MLKFLKSMSVFVVAALVCFSLYSFLNVKNSQDYIRDLRDANPSIRKSAAVALGKRKVMKAVSALKRAAHNEKDYSVRAAMQKAMFECSGIVVVEKK